ncbi:MAG: aminopeptidase P family protein, partial [Alcaligenaceae bacterium]|nr:aminopeptidase P family protein [Alcaligenaceae bacterium]
MLTVPERIEALREQMQIHGLDAWLVYTADPHLSEYLPEHWSQREYLSGFSGSAAYMAVTQDKASLWTDSRYWVQAEAQLKDSGIALMKMGAQGTPGLEDWVKEQLSAGQAVGVNGLALSVAQALKLEESLGQAELELVVEHELLDAFWEERPALPQAPIYEHDAKYAGLSRQQKITQVREAMRELDSDVHLISALDDIAWILNLRGSDVEYNPVFLSHLILTEGQALLYVDSVKLSETLLQELATDGVELRPYDAVTADLRRLLADEQTTLLVDAARTAWTICEPYTMQAMLALNPSQRL